jgi:hypothetical protein
MNIILKNKSYLRYAFKTEFNGAILLTPLRLLNFITDASVYAIGVIVDQCFSTFLHSRTHFHIR